MRNHKKVRADSIVDLPLNKKVEQLESYERSYDRCQTSITPPRLHAQMFNSQASSCGSYEDVDIDEDEYTPCIDSDPHNQGRKRKTSNTRQPISEV